MRFIQSNGDAFGMLVDSIEMLGMHLGSMVNLGRKLTFSRDRRQVIFGLDFFDKFDQIQRYGLIVEKINRILGFRLGMQEIL